MDIKLKEDVKIVYPDSALYSKNAEEFSDDLNSSISRKDKKILLSFKKMNTINSAIMGKILDSYSNIRNKGGEFIITDTGNDISELFRITGVNKVIKIFKSEAEGLEYLERR